MAARLVVVLLGLAAALLAPAPSGAAAGLDRSYDPVTIAGADLATLPTRSTTRLRLMRVRDGALEPIRHQFDERDDEGDLIVDGPADFDLDDDDELVFMAEDAGERAPDALLPGGVAVLEIEVSDPGTGATAWAYLLAHAEPQPAPAFEPHVLFDLASGEARSDCYRVQYARERNFYTDIVIPEASGGNASSLLHQTRMRGSPTFSLLFADVTLDFTEQNSIVAVEGVRSGPVRAVRRVRLSVDLGALFPDLPSGTAYTYHYRCAYLTPTRVGFPWIMLQTLRDFRFENVFDFRSEALPIRYFDAWHPGGIELSSGSPLEIRTTEDREWWAHDGEAGTMLHSLVIPRRWREWGVVRGTILRAGSVRGGDAGEEDEDAAGRDAKAAAGYTLLNMTSLREAGEYDLLMASFVLPAGYHPGAETEALAMLRTPLTVTVRRVR